MSVSLDGIADRCNIATRYMIPTIKSPQDYAAYRNALCFMIPNEDFVELIRSGTPVELDEEDFRVLMRT